MAGSRLGVGDMNVLGSLCILFLGPLSCKANVFDFREVGSAKDLVHTFQRYLQKDLGLANDFVRAK